MTGCEADWRICGERHLDGDGVDVEARQVVGALAADADQVEDPADVDRERVLTRADVDLRAVAEHRDRLLAHGVVAVGERVLADVVGRRDALADLDARSVALLAPERPGLPNAQVRIGDRADRADVVEERPRIGGRGVRPQRPGAIGLAVAVPVDVEAVARRVVEVVVVRPLGRRFQRNDVRDHRHRPGPVRAREQVVVGQVCGRVVGDQRSLAVARCHCLARPAGRERCRSQHKRGSAGRNARRNGGTHTHGGVPPCSDSCRRAPPASCRAVFVITGRSVRSRLSRRGRRPPHRRAGPARAALAGLQRRRDRPGDRARPAPLRRRHHRALGGARRRLPLRRPGDGAGAAARGRQLDDPVRAEPLLARPPRPGAGRRAGDARRARAVGELAEAQAGARRRLGHPRVLHDRRACCPTARSTGRSACTTASHGPSARTSRPCWRCWRASRATRSRASAPAASSTQPSSA